MPIRVRPSIACGWTGVAATLLVLPAVAAQRAEGAGTWRTDFSRSTVDLAEIVPGGPPRDGIPPIDRPRFVPIEAATWLTPREPVVVVATGARVKLYPLQILIWHEIVNDVVGARAVAVTYCPLCNTALVFERQVDGRLLDFGTTGQLRHSDLIMYDRQSESWWQQATGEAIVGTMAGRRLVPVEAQLVAWSEAARQFPDALVLSRETGYQRPYGRNPYQRYDREGGGPLRAFFPRPADARLAAMERVVTLELAGRPAAYPFGRLQREQVIHDAAGGEVVVVFWAAGTASAVDTDAFGQGRDVGAVGVFDPRIDDQRLQFKPIGGGRFQDTATGTIWDLFGVARAGPLAGRQLRPIAHGNHFWFAWAAFRPETRLASD